MALESLRDARPGMLIDHIEENPGAAKGLTKHSPLFMRLRSHCEARTFDELRVYELGRLVREGDPDWHSAVVELIYQGRAIMVDTTGLVADPASEGGGRSSERQRAGQPHRRPASSTTPRAHGSAGAPTPPPVSTSTAPSWDGGAQRPPSIELPRGPQPLGRPVAPKGASAPAAHTRGAAPSPAPQRARPGLRFSALCEGHIFCPTCAQALTIQSLGHERHLYYACANKHLHPPTESQPEVFFPVESVDGGVWSRISLRLEDPQLALEILREAAAKGAAGGQSRKAQIRSRLERIERDEIEVLGLRSQDRISEGAARHRLDEIRTERRKLEEELNNDAGSDNKLAPLSKAVEELVAFGNRSAQPVEKADFGLRRRVVQACLPPTAEYGIFPHVDGTLEIRDLLEEVAFTPGLKHRARSLGRLAGSLKDRIAEARPDRPADQPSLFARMSALIRRQKDQAASESQDLGKALRASMHEHEPLALSVRPPSRPNWLLYGFLLVGAALIAILFQPASPTASQYENQVETQGLVEQLLELHEVPGGWIGVTRPEWAGSHDKQLAAELCASMAARLQPALNETIMLMVPGGLPIAECRAPKVEAGVAQ